ncbi:hypothetical protein [Salinimonas lutimaris]|uniref:hypothetical protein n=1 Tax=Salinimonas lutimaris TaxID=914153 RepID=UPI0010BFCC42|nr:hypothetical protein [Salinimonas lutimaris]
MFELAPFWQRYFFINMTNFIYFKLPYYIAGTICFHLNILVKQGRLEGSELQLDNAPNFLASFVLIAIFLFFSKKVTLAEIFGVTTALIIYEFMQLFIPGRTFDFLDIAATVAAAITATLYMSTTNALASWYRGRNRQPG